MFSTGRSTLSLLAILLVAVLALAACGGGGQQDTAPAEPAAQEEAATEGEGAEEPAAEAPATSGAVVVGTNAEYQPFEFVDANGDIIGFDIDLMNALAEEAGLEIEFVNTKWDGIFVALANGEFDAVISAVTITPERGEVVDFTEPYFNAGQAVAVRGDNDAIAGVESLVEGISVGVQLGTTGDIYATDNLPVEVSRFDETPLAIQALANGDVDAVVADAPTLADYIKANPDLGLKVVGEPFTDEFYGIAVNKERTDVLDALNAALATVQENGVYDELFATWFGTPEVIADAAEGEAAAGR